MSDVQANSNPNRFTLTADQGNDDGSLKVGSALPNHTWAKGQKIQLEGEPQPRTISYVMGKGDKTHLCTAGFGKFPKNQKVSFRLVNDAEQATAIQSEAVAA
jgi:hypothetical protein